MKRSFISLYQETVQQQDSPKSPDPMLGTQTRTDAREESDQDPRSFGTQTQTFTRETFDTDAFHVQYSVIP